MAKIWDIPFANAGDKQVIPVPAQPDGTISTTQGWTPDYELPNTNPSYKPVGREEMNGALFEITESIQQLQLQGAAEWSPLFSAYPNGAEVTHLGNRWRSTTSGNNTIPGDVGATWALVGASASETVAGIAEIATQTETNTGTDDLRIVTPLKLKSGFAISLTANGYIKLPAFLGGLIFQWGSDTSTSGAEKTITYPIPFPSNVFFVQASALSGTDSYASINANTLTNYAMAIYQGSTSARVARSFKWLAVGN